jgi:hypothetical protein
MSYRQIYTCDHCEKESNGAIYASIWGESDGEKGYTHTRIDGCSKEHLSLAVAKALGIGIDGKAVELLAAKDLQIAELTKQRDTEHGLAQLRAIEIDTWKKELTEARERIAELESRLDAAEVLQMARERIVLEDDPTGYFRGILDAVEASLTGPKKPTKPLVCPICHTIENHPVYIIETMPPSYEVKFCNGTKATFDEDPRK